MAIAGSSARTERDAWLTDVQIEGKSAATLDAYRHATNKLLEAYPEKAFADFTYDDLTEYLGPLPERQRAQRASIFRTWFRWGMRTRRVTEDPTALLPHMKWPRPERVGRLARPFSELEIAALEALSEPDGTLMAIMLETGLKKGEARQLRVRMCELDAKQLRLPEGITRHPRRIPLDEVLVDRLRRFFEAEHIAGDDYVWPTRPGGGRVRHDRLIGDPSFHMWWTSRVAAAKVSYRSPKTARDTYAVRLRNRGLGLDDIQVLLGHNDVRVTTSIYAPHRYDDVKKRLEELQEHQLTAEEIDKAMMDTRTRIAAARDTGDEQAMSEAVNELRGLVERLPAALGIA